MRVIRVLSYIEAHGLFEYRPLGEAAKVVSVW
jgi:hypothetical protein